MQISTIEIAGFVAAFKALRLPYKLEQRSILYFTHSFSDNLYTKFDSTAICTFSDKDIALLQSLIKKGDSHGKVNRGIEVWVEITMPIYFMIEFDTYRIGCDTLSTSSTMLTDLKQLQGEELQQAKGKIKGDYEYTRIFKVTYQTLRNIWLDRENHRLPEWQQFIEYIKTLPLANELILVK